LEAAETAFMTQFDSPPLRLGTHLFSSRLIVGTGKYSTFEQMRECLEISGADVITVAVRRERLVDAAGRNILDFIDLKRYTILPNTAGCFTADDAVRTARLGREILLGLENRGANWIKLEVLADKKKRYCQILWPRWKRQNSWLRMDLRSSAILRTIRLSPAG